MLIYSMGMSVDGFVTDREGGIGWSVPSDALFRFHYDRVGQLGATLLGRRLYQTMLVWENDPAFRETELDAAFAEVWTALPKVVFSRTLDSVQGNARLATRSLAEEVAAALESAEHVEIGGAALAAQAIQLGLVDDFRMFRYPVALGGGTPYLPPLTAELRLELAETKVFDVGVVYERYLRARA